MNRENIQKLSSLCAIALSPTEQAQMVVELSSIVQFVDQINTVQTDDVDPLIHPNATEPIELCDDSDTAELDNFDAYPEVPVTQHFYLIPKVIKP